MKTDIIKEAFFELLRAGLWEKDAWLLPYEPLSFDALYKLAEEQSIVGVIAAGLEHVKDKKITKQEAIQFLKRVYSLENRNSEMNLFIEETIERLRKAGVYAMLIKGQGIAQCYCRPQWRSAGDIDLLLDNENYQKAKSLLLPIASSTKEENKAYKHLGMTIRSWTVELHGTLYGGLPNHINRVLDQIQKDSLHYGSARGWRNGETDIFLPFPDNDIIIVFTHILQHFFRGGIGLRQICDWCRLLWTYRNTIDLNLLELRIREMRVLTEWKAFASFVVDFLGMPLDAMPLYDPAPRWREKANRICAFILKVGNFGHNRDTSYYDRYPYVIYKMISFGRHISDFFEHLFIFPQDSLRVLGITISDGVKAIAKGK